MKTLFHSSDCIVEMNSSGEIFVRNPHTQARLCISVQYNAGMICTSGNGDGHLEPWALNGLPAFIVVPPRR